jgi:glycosyltransferase involved in cell wall biosynthesis
MKTPLLIVQRFYYSFREGFFEYLADNQIEFELINATTSKGKVKVSTEAKNKPFILKTFYFHLGDFYVIFPFLFFKLIFINPKVVVSEGGQNTINNIQIWLYSKVFRKKYIIWDLGKGYADFGNSFFRGLYMNMYVRILKNASFVFGYNTQSKSYFESLGIESEKIIVLNNTIDTRKIESLKKKYIPFVPEELKPFTGNGFTFMIFVGALARTKNIEALALLLKALGPEYFLIIIGDGPKEYVDELAECFKGTNHVFAGYKKNEQLFPYYGMASFAVLPGLGGLSINQAMAFGVPVVCKSADGAEKDLVRNDETGYIYNDIDDACRYIKSKSSKEWKEMGENAGHLLYAEHNVESMMERFLLYCNKI